MDKQNSANQKQIHAGISKITVVVAELEDFFHQADVETSNDRLRRQRRVGIAHRLHAQECLGEGKRRLFIGRQCLALRQQQKR